MARGNGIYLARKPTDTGNWFVGVNVQGASGKWSVRWVSTGTKDRGKAEAIRDAMAATRENRRAEETMARALALVGAGEVRRRVRLADLWSFYEEHAERRASGNTERLRRQKVERFQEWMALRHPEVEFVHEVSLRIAGEYWGALRREGMAPATRNVYRAMLMGVWKQIAVAAELPDNVWGQIVPDEGESVSLRPLSLEEVGRLVEVAEGFESVCHGFWPVAIRIGMETGLREGDVASLRGSDFEWGDGVLAVRTGKTGALSYHSLSRPWVKLLPRVVGDAPLWPEAARVARVQGQRWLGSEFRALCEAAGIETERAPSPGERRKQAVKLVTFHSLRHTFVTLLMESGRLTHADLVAQGNWSNERVVRGVYDGAKESQGRRAALEVAAAWEEIERRAEG